MPLGEQLREHPPAVFRELVEPLVAFPFFTPLAGQETLCLEPSEQGVQRALVYDQAVLAKPLAKRVAVLLGAKRGEDRDD